MLFSAISVISIELKEIAVLKESLLFIFFVTLNLGTWNKVFSPINLALVSGNLTISATTSIYQSDCAWVFFGAKKSNIYKVIKIKIFIMLKNYLVVTKIKIFKDDVLYKNNIFALNFL